MLLKPLFPQREHLKSIEFIGLGLCFESVMMLLLLLASVQPIYCGGEVLGLFVVLLVNTIYVEWRALPLRR